MRSLKDKIYQGFFDNIGTPDISKAKKWFSQVYELCKRSAAKGPEYWKNDTLTFDKIKDSVDELGYGFGIKNKKGNIIYMRSKKFEDSGNPFEYCTLKGAVITPWEISTPVSFVWRMIMDSIFNNEDIQLVYIDEKGNCKIINV